MSSDCVICGQCWWAGCDLAADYELDVPIKRHGRLIYDGHIDLCAGHARYAVSSGGHLNLNWTALEQAIARQHNVV